ncbi:hypothetical protein [Hydrogenophaga sp. MI9]|uniref:hypothetical protein n=1 Tax=Hydrogenophaga sp. MI9 TaxID=3453719 RepID=UPI003EED5B82
MNIFAKACIALLVLVSAASAYAQTGNVYKALNARCRIADSRVISSPLPASTVRNLDVTAISSYATQGGTADAAGCGIPTTAQALAVSLTVLPPAGASGFFKIFPYLGAWQDGNTVNFSGVGITNDVIVREDTGPSAAELSIYSSAQTDYVVDVVGYFEPPAVPTLSCVTTANTTVSVAAGATQNVIAPVCASGYVPTSTNCESGSWQMPFVFVNGGTCSAQNNGGSAAELRASRTCCRVQ